MSEESDYAADPVTPDRAFVESDSHSLGTLALQPYTPSRVVAAQAMGLHYGMLSEEEMAQYSAKGSYPQSAHDVAVVLWLCSLTDPAAIARAAVWPFKAIPQAVEWAGEQGIIHPSDERFWQALQLFESIMAEVSVSRTSLKLEPGEETSSPKA